MPRLQELHTAYRDRGLSIVAVEAARDTERAKRFIADQGISFLCLEDRDENPVVTGLFGVHAFPTSFILDSSGKIMYYHLGFDEGDEKKIAEEIEALLDD